MQFPLSQIIEGIRFRKDYGDLEELKDSLNTLGQLQSILIDGNNNLIAGGRRFRAMTELGWEHCQVMKLDETVDEEKLRTMELTENIMRTDMSWQEQVLTMLAIYRAQQKKASSQFEQYTLKQAGQLFKQSFSRIAYIVRIAEALELGDEEVANCSGVTDACQILAGRNERVLLDFKAAARAAEQKKQAIYPSGVVQSEQSTETAAATKVVETGALSLAYVEQNHFILGDSIRVLMPALPPESIDHILTDIPYGISMKNLDTMTNISQTEGEHDVEENVDLMPLFLQQAYRVLRKHAYCIFFYDLDHHNYLQTLAREVGFSVQSWPLIWNKTSPCRNSAPHCNWTKSFEAIMVMRKVQPSLNRPQTSCVLTGGLSPEDKKNFPHPFTKPESILLQLLSAFATPGQTILDPYAGTGSIVCAIHKFGCKPLGMEKMPHHHETALPHVARVLSIPYSPPTPEPPPADDFS